MHMAIVRGAVVEKVHDVDNMPINGLPGEARSACFMIAFQIRPEFRHKDEILFMKPGNI
jgi:hypothetical protein